MTNMTMKTDAVDVVATSSTSTSTTTTSNRLYITDFTTTSCSKDNRDVLLEKIQDYFSSSSFEVNEIYLAESLKFCIIRFMSTKDCERALHEFNEGKKNTMNVTFFTTMEIATNSYNQGISKKTQLIQDHKLQKKLRILQKVGVACGSGEDEEEQADYKEILLIQTNKSHSQRIHDWVLNETTTMETNCTVNSMILSKDSAMIFVVTTYKTKEDPNKTLLSTRIWNTWYVSAKIHRTILLDTSTVAMDRTEKTTTATKTALPSFVIEGNLRDTIIPIIWNKIQQLLLDEDESTETSASTTTTTTTTTTTIRISTYPTKLQNPILNLLEETHPSQQQSTRLHSIRFSPHDYTHTVSIIQLHQNGSNDFDGLYVIGKIESTVTQESVISATMTNNEDDDDNNNNNAHTSFQFHHYPNVVLPKNVTTQTPSTSCRRDIDDDGTKKQQQTQSLPNNRHINNGR